MRLYTSLAYAAITHVNRPITIALPLRLILVKNKAKSLHSHIHSLISSKVTPSNLPPGLSCKNPNNFPICDFGVWSVGVLWPSGPGVVRMWVRIPVWPVAALVHLSKTLNHNCFVLRMGRQAVGPVCCVMHVKEPRIIIIIIIWQCVKTGCEF